MLYPTVGFLLNDMAYIICKFKVLYSLYTSILGVSQTFLENFSNRATECI